MLTQEKLKEFLIYKHGVLVWRTSRNNQVQKGVRAGHLRPDGRRSIRIAGMQMLEHRAVYLYHYGYLPPFIDHKNGDPCDNRIENLREATRSQNNHNAKLRKDNTSGVKGVTWVKREQKWKARLCLDGKFINLGTFSTKEAAAEVVRDARTRIHGEYARHN